MGPLGSAAGCPVLSHLTCLPGDAASTTAGDTGCSAFSNPCRCSVCRAVLRAAARECQLTAQPGEAVEAYLAAGDARAALAILNLQLAEKMPQAVEGAASGGAAVSATGCCGLCCMRWVTGH